MDNLYTLVFGICGVLLAVEVISRLFPEKSGELIRGLAVLSVLGVLIAGVLETDFDLEFQYTDSVSAKMDTLDNLAAEKGISLLKERLYALLEAAGIEIIDEVQGLEVRYRQDNPGRITIDRVCVRVKYGSDMDRAFALLRSVLTEAIPIEIYTE